MTLSSHRRLLVLLACSLMVLGLAFMPAQARAAESYSSEAWDCGGTWASGSFDRTGTFYFSCYQGLYKRVRNTVTATRISATVYTDVAPSPDGAVLYTTSGYPNFEVRRHVRDGAGAYNLDPTWRLRSVAWAGTNTVPRGSYIATDGLGDLYVSQGMWATDATHPNTIFKFRPDGTFITRFGQIATGQPNQASSWQLGSFYWNVAGVAASADGSRVYTAEVGNNRITIFRRVGDGSYVSDSTFGNTAADDNPATVMYYDAAASLWRNDEARAGSCANAKFAAPYDVATDAWDMVYVSNTTCAQVQKFDAVGNFQYNSPKLTTGNGHIHGIAVDGDGNIYAGEVNRKLRNLTPRAGAWPVPQPPRADVAAPTLSSVVTPATTVTPQIQIGLTATDDIGVTEVRVAKEDGVWLPWRPYAPLIPHTLTAGTGFRVVTVQVRDAAGKESATITRQVLISVAATPTPTPVPAPAPTKPIVGGGPANRPGPVAAIVDLPPSIGRVHIPAPVKSQIITIAVTATDDQRVVQVRSANEDGIWTGWQTYTGKHLHALSPGASVKAVSVQVRDGRGNVSDIKTVRIGCRPCREPSGFLRVSNPAGRATASHVKYRGSKRADRVTSLGYKDEVFSYQQADSGAVDRIDCGLGQDVAHVRKGDLTINCERVIRHR